MVKRTRRKDTRPNPDRAPQTFALAAAVFLTGAATLQAGCSKVAIAPPYSQQELKTECERRRGTWRPDALTGGFCEYRAAQSTTPGTSRAAEPRESPQM